MSAPAPSSAFAKISGPFWAVAWPGAIALVYALAHLNWYLGTPLGQVPVLDEREQLDFANAIFGGALPAEAFYRAPGYALALAGLRVLGVSAGGLFSAALTLGVVLHALNAVLIARIARRWFGPTAALAAGLLAALHPVFVHYATQALDATPALTMFLLGLDLIAPAWSASANAGRWCSASVCWAAAALLRPNYLFAWGLLPLLAATKLCAGPRWPRAFAALGSVTLFGALALWQWRVSGEPGFLPTQGAYNLWAANQPGAHGRYYTQRIDLPARFAGQNPARVESLLLYAQATGRPADDLAAANAYWRQRTRDEIFAHPLAWLGRLARKTYALLNDWEQYNNKTFAFHQALSPWLRWNPLSWGLLLVLGVIGAVRLRQVAPRVVVPLILVAAAIGGGVVLFFVSARFRLPLAALLCVLAGGALADPIGVFRALDPRRRGVLLLALIGAAAIAFSNFDGVRDTRPFVQDHLLLAHAAQTVGDDLTVWQEASAVLALDPARREAIEFLVTSGFNRQLTAALAPAEFAMWRAYADRLLDRASNASPSVCAIAAIATRDTALLHVLAHDAPAPVNYAALGALALLNFAEPAELARLRAAPLDAGPALQWMARQVIEPDVFAVWAQPRHPPEWTRAIAEARARLFPAPANAAAK